MISHKISFWSCSSSKEFGAWARVHLVAEDIPLKINLHFLGVSGKCY